VFFIPNYCLTVRQRCMSHLDHLMLLNYELLNEPQCTHSGFNLTQSQVLFVIDSNISMARVVAGLYWLTNDTNIQVSAISSSYVVINSYIFRATTTAEHHTKMIRMLYKCAQAPVAHGCVRPTSYRLLLIV